jgi:hypothetical protein
MSRKIVKGVALYLGYEAVTLALAYLLLPFGGVAGGIGFLMLGAFQVGIVGIPAAHLMESDWMNRMTHRFACCIADRVIERRDRQSAGI